MMTINRIAVLFIIIGTLLFGMGYHGVDIAWNMHTVNRDFNASYVDVSLGGNVIYTPAEAYRQGQLWMFYGFVAAIYGCLWVNYEFKVPSFRKKKKQENESDNLLIKAE
jgi:hypothetical protein